MNEAPDYVIEAERVVMDWGHRHPVDCITYAGVEPTRNSVGLEIEYHLGAYVAASTILRGLYHIAGIDRKHLIPDLPPWHQDAIETMLEVDGGDAGDE